MLCFLLWPNTGIIGFPFDVLTFDGTAERKMPLGVFVYAHDLRNVPNGWLPVLQMQQLFEAMDANHDEVLSREEFEQAF